MQVLLDVDTVCRGKSRYGSVAAEGQCWQHPRLSFEWMTEGEFARKFYCITEKLNFLFESL